MIAASVFLLLLWQLASVILKIAFLPAPFTVALHIINKFAPVISVHLAYSVGRILSGVLISLAAGFLLGMLMGRNAKADKLFSPVIYILYPVPKIALLPLVMLIFGLGELSKVFMIAMIIFFQVLVSSRDFIKTIPDTAFNVIRSFGASRKDEIIKVIIPAALPSLLSSVRVSLGTALSVLFFTENFGTRYGMGYFIMDAWMRVDYVGMYSGIAILGLTGFLLFKALDILERKLCPWHL